MMIRVLAIFIILMLPASMALAEGGGADKLMQLDRDFSSHSAKLGAKSAWEKYMAESSVQLNAGEQPTIGKDRIMEGFAAWPDYARLTWAPLGGDISASGDLGYTWGRYVYRTKDAEGKEVESHGKYMTIWKLQTDGSWKVVLDGGNQNPPPGPE
ncbi:MAG: nuclear transport factor 2 family protein [Sphingomonadales bacterium]